MLSTSPGKVVQKGNSTVFATSARVSITMIRGAVCFFLLLLLHSVLLDIDWAYSSVITARRGSLSESRSSIIFVSAERAFEVTTEQISSDTEKLQAHRDAATERNVPSSSTALSDDEVFLRIARDFRSVGSLTRAARFYEFTLEKGRGNLRPLVQLELAELLEQDPSLSSTYTYLDLLIDSASAGNAEAQHKVAVMYATGVAARDLVPMDALRALTLEYMAALAGHPLATMGMGYRYLNGIGVSQSCELALPFYEYAANHAAQLIESTGQAPHPDRMKISDALDPHAKWMKREGTQELTDYYAHLSDNGDTSAALMLGNLYAMGTRLIPQDELQAIRYLNISAVQGRNAAAMGQLGYILAKLYHQRFFKKESHTFEFSFERNSFGRQMPGETVDGAGVADNAVPHLDLEEIHSLLHYAARKGDANGVVGMGFLHYHGIADGAGSSSSSKNISGALEYFQKALGSHLDAGFYLGEIFMGQTGDELQDVKEMQSGDNYDDDDDDGYEDGSDGSIRRVRGGQQRSAPTAVSIDLNAALRSYNMAAQLGNVLAQHRLGHLLKRGVGSNMHRNCNAAVQSFRFVAERGFWMRGLARGHRLYYEGDRMSALREFIELAAIGVESAQYNAAYILSSGSSSSSGSVPQRNSNGAFDARYSTINGANGWSSAATESNKNLQQQCPPVDKSPLGKWDRDTDLRRKERQGQQLAQRHGHRSRGSEQQQLSDAGALNFANFYQQRVQKAENASAAVNDNQTAPNAAHLAVEQWTMFLKKYEPSALSQSAPVMPATSAGQYSHRTAAAAAGKDRNYDVDSIRRGLRASHAAATLLRRRCAECEARAMLLFDLCAAQGNAEAFLQLGDIYYYQKAGIDEYDINDAERSFLNSAFATTTSGIKHDGISSSSSDNSFEKSSDSGESGIRNIVHEGNSHTAEEQRAHTPAVNNGFIMLRVVEAEHLKQRSEEGKSAQYPTVEFIGMERFIGTADVSRTAATASDETVASNSKWEAAMYYQKAADLRHTQALFNLGLMHESGDGVTQDFHLAQRYYDLAAGVDPKAKVPRDLALVMLQGHKLFHSLLGPSAATELLDTGLMVRFDLRWLSLMLPQQQLISLLPALSAPELVPSARVVPEHLKTSRVESKISGAANKIEDKAESVILVEVTISLRSMLWALRLLDSAVRYQLDQLCAFYDSHMRQSVRNFSSTFYAQSQLQRQLPKWIANLFRNHNRAHGDAADDGIPPAFRAALNELPAEVAAQLGQVHPNLQPPPRNQNGAAADGAGAANHAHFLDLLQRLPVRLATLFSKHLRILLNQAYMHTHGAVQRFVDVSIGQRSVSSSSEANVRNRRFNSRSAAAAGASSQKNNSDPSQDGQRVIFSKDEFTLLILLLMGFTAVLIFKIMRRQIVAGI